jgi:acyl-CoA reductase-like NAD-dependent aldehyde dehydrogenase
VINRANATTAGLGGSVWSKNIGHAEDIAKRIESGTIWINAMARVDPKAVFSGHKSSGLGSEFGVHALTSFSNIQSLVIYKQ